MAKGAQQLFESMSVGAGQCPFGSRKNVRHGQAQQLIDQGVLAGEPAVDGADADAGPGGDLLHAGAGAGLAEYLARGVEDEVIVPRGVGGPGHWPVSPASAEPAAIAVPAGSNSAATGCGSRGEGISRPASPASTRPPAMAAKPVV